jgi:hypothetical protein
MRRRRRELQRRAEAAAIRMSSQMRVDHSSSSHCGNAVIDVARIQLDFTRLCGRFKTAMFTKTRALQA